MDSHGHSEWQNFAQAWMDNEDRLLAPRRPLNQKLVELCELGPSSRLMDFGTGVGEPAITAAKSNPGIPVHGVDTSQAMVNFARERAERERAPNFHPHCISGEKLPFAKGFFTAVTSSFALEFSNNWAADLEEIARVLAVHGKFVLATWVDSLIENPFQALVPWAVREAIGPRPLAHDRIFRFRESGPLIRAAKGFQLSHIRKERIAGKIEYRSIEDFWKLKKIASPSSRNDLAGLSEAEFQKVNELIRKKLEDMKVSQTSIFVPFAAEILVFAKMP